MKKIILIATLVCFAFVSRAQKKKKLTEDFGVYRDVTEIVKSGKERIKDGFYSREHYGKSEVVIEGQYSSGLRSGNWIYRSNGEVIATGKYSENKKTGIWEYKQVRQKIRMTYDHDADSLLSFTSAPHEYEIFEDGNFVLSPIDRIPINPDYITEFHETLNYPRNALRMGIEGKCLLEFIVTEKGEIQDPIFIQSIGAGTNEEILQALRRLSNNFLPALKNNKPIKIKRYLLVEYNLNFPGCCPEVIWSLI